MLDFIYLYESIDLFLYNNFLYLALFSAIIYMKRKVIINKVLGIKTHKA